MTADEKQKICDNIFQYITKKLDDWMDNQIFTKTSMKKLGELYYNHVLNEVENADTHLLNAVIRTVRKIIISHCVKFCISKNYRLKCGLMLKENMMKYLFRNMAW